MRIAFLSLFLPPQMYGGVPMQVHHQAAALTKRGHDVTVFSLYPGYEDAPYNVHVVRLPRIWEAHVQRLRGLAMLLFPWYLAKESFDDFDVIHAHGDSHFVRTRTPVLRTFYSTGIDQALHARTWRRRIGMLSLVPFELASGYRADTIIYQSEAQARWTPWLKGKVIPNGVDIASFQPGTRRSPHPSILFVAGTMGGSKRGQLLIDAFRNEVRRHVPDADLWMVCPERPKAPGVVALGSVTPERLRELYQQAWVFCLPSSWEGFGVPYIEAMASGTPVVATPNAGAVEVLDHGRYGVLTPPQCLGQTLSALLLDENKRHRLRDLGLQRAKDFDLERVVDSYEQEYIALLHKQAVSDTAR